ncbi:hypothetical protein CQW23_06527 [Capsicum baccatum]|uniref:Uncharacterized protein n=1 Tax=Capsicum baccatum TaxID=33114 RepID=A0A2G2X3J8_CAPBA|nr:hypothetical protein CQW23_06527 [Capsicum baccatum]
MAHESVASLLRIIESLLTFNSSMQSLFCDHSEDFSALYEKISSLDVVVKNFEKNYVSGEMKDLEVEVKEVESAAEYTIQLIVTEVVLGEGINGSRVSSSSKDMRNVENSMVGRDDQRERLVEDITRSYSGEPKVIPIVWMGGIVSQQHNVKEILLSLLRSTKGGTFDMNDEAELANMLQRSLKDESWSLFKSVAFSSEASPYEFETVEQKIADECHGLPLTIVMVAGLLKSKRTKEDWESVAKDVKSFVINDPDERDDN